MTTILTARPRDVDYLRAAAILYGDLGTSKAYVLGLAFLLAGYSSFWYILAVCFLTLLVGISYIFITKAYPSGGGVYTSVRQRSKVLALIAAFFLISDYLVTASLSALSAFHYLGMLHPEYGAILAICFIGLLNFLGPKHTGSLALGLAIPTMAAIILLGIMSLPFLPEAIHNLQPLSGNLKSDWNIFVGIIVALSGIESIANATSSMKLDPGSTDENPSVAKTSTPAILIVIIEVCIFTALLGLAMNALPGLNVYTDKIGAPGYADVRDAMLRYMAEVFAGTLFGAAIGQAFAVFVMIVIALLLLSAVNTSMIALISLLYTMSKDDALPALFQKLNGFGVPIYGTLLAFICPMIILLVVHDIAGLANLYAIGFVGAIAVNLAATATNFTLDIKSWQRLWMLGTFVIMALAEITLFIDKPQARNFALTIIGIGLLLRSLAAEKREKEAHASFPHPALPKIPDNATGAMMAAVNGVGKSLDFALEEASKTASPLFVLFVREKMVVAEDENTQLWSNDEDARTVYNHMLTYQSDHPMEFLYTVTAHPVHSIIQAAKQKRIHRLIMGRKRGVSTLLHVLRGTTIRNLSRHLPKEIDLVIIV